MTDLAAASSAEDLATWSRDWSRQWWDREAHLVFNPAGSFGELVPARSVHLTPQSAWVAYGLLGSKDTADHVEADAAIGALLGLQYDAPGAVFHGTFARFPEAPYPPDEPTMWEDYDPNWRQFVGTTFALILEDFPDRLSDARRGEMMASIRLACAGEEAEGRLGPSYANPALMHAWLDGWCGRRIGDEAQIQRAERFAAGVVERFDRFGGFDEFNSPTYYGIDLYALALWRTFPPTRRFADDGARVEAAIWQEAAQFHHAGLDNFCGPFTRSYGPDATRTVTLLGIWIWAALGRAVAPLPDVSAQVIDHGHDLMAGPLIARLAARSASDGDQAPFAGFDARRERQREIRRALPGGRSITAFMFADLMIGAEASDHDWGGWNQFMPAVAHWREPDGVGVLWLAEPYVVRAVVDDHRLDLEAERPGRPPRIELLLSAPSCAMRGAEISTERMRITIDDSTNRIDVAAVGDRLHRVVVTPSEPNEAVVQCTLTFAVMP